MGQTVERTTVTLQDDVKAVLVAYTPLATAFIGGIKTFDELGGIGININSYPAAFDSNLQLRPIIVIRERAIIPTPQIADEITRATSVSQSLDIHFMQDRRLGWDALETGQSTVFSLLQYSRIGQRAISLRSSARMERDRGMDNACVLWSVYDTFGIMT